MLVLCATTAFKLIVIISAKPSAQLEIYRIVPAIRSLKLVLNANQDILCHFLEILALMPHQTPAHARKVVKHARIISVFSVLLAIKCPT